MNASRRGGVRRRRDDAPPPHPLLWIAGAVGLAFVGLPLLGLVTEAPWSRWLDLVTSPAVAEAARLSLLIPLAAAALAFVVGAPVGQLLAARFPGRGVRRTRVVLPIVLPPVVGGMALLAALGPDGVLGSLLARSGIVLTGTATGAILAGAFVAFPLVVLAAESGFRSLDASLAEAAATLGASRWYAFRRIALPSLRPQLLAAITLAWARALGEFGATATFAGTVPGRTATLPLTIYAVKEADPGAAIALSLLLVVISAAVLIPLRDRILAR
ncbi:MAG: molybdate ABC transporter permease subunit [Actinomycetota bacterium]